MLSKVAEQKRCPRVQVHVVVGAPSRLGWLCRQFGWNDEAKPPPRPYHPNKLAYDFGGGIDVFQRMKADCDIDCSISHFVKAAMHFDAAASGYFSCGLPDFHTYPAHGGNARNDPAGPAAEVEDSRSATSEIGEQRGTQRLVVSRGGALALIEVSDASITGVVRIWTVHLSPICLASFSCSE